jgi:hypothetical protein
VKRSKRRIKIITFETVRGITKNEELEQVGGETEGKKLNTWDLWRRHSAVFHTLSSNKDNFSQRKHYLHYKMLHVPSREGHHQARVNKRKAVSWNCHCHESDLFITAFSFT